MLTGALAHYTIVRSLAVGGMGEVFLARNTLLGRDAVIKRILPELAGHAQIVQRFLLEARAAALLEHRNVIRIYDAVTDAAGVPYLVLEYLHGESVAEWLKRWCAEGPGVRPGLVPTRPVPPARALIFLAGAGAGLNHAHERRILHRDIKPDNLFITAAPPDQLASLAAVGLPTDACIKVLDFGIAKLVEEGGSGTRTGTAIGTPLYMAPEQLRGRPVDARTDLYALAATAYQLVTGGRLPFEGTTMADIAVLQDSTPPPDPRTFAPDLPAGVAKVIRTAMARQPADRYASIAEFLRALAAEVPAADGLPDGRRILQHYAPELLQAATVAPSAAHALSRKAETDALPGVASMPTTLGSSAYTGNVVPPPRRGLWIALGASGLAAAIVAVAVMSGGGDDAPSAPEPAGIVPISPLVARDAGASGDAAPLDAAPDAQPVDAATPVDAAPPVDARPSRRNQPRNGSGADRGIRAIPLNQ